MRPTGNRLDFPLRFRTRIATRAAPVDRERADEARSDGERARHADEDVRAKLLRTTLLVEVALRVARGAFVRIVARQGLTLDVVPIDRKEQSAP